MAWHRRGCRGENAVNLTGCQAAGFFAPTSAGDTLKGCHVREGSTRPTNFKTPGDAKLFLVTYQREKP